MTRKTATVALVAAVAVAVAAGMALRADEFTKKDQERWQKEYMTVVQKGRELWTSPTLGTNGVACAQCHPNGANTHPETYPKFQQQLGQGHRAAGDDQLVHPAAAGGQAARARQPRHGRDRGLRRLRAARSCAGPRQALTSPPGAAGRERPAAPGVRAQNPGVRLNWKVQPF